MSELPTLVIGLLLGWLAAVGCDVVRSTVKVRAQRLQALEDANTKLMAHLELLRELANELTTKNQQHDREIAGFAMRFGVRREGD